MEPLSNIYMVTLLLSELDAENLVQLLPYQQTVIQRFTAEGKLLHYALSLENNKIWMVFYAQNKEEIPGWISCFPICRYGNWQIQGLEQYHVHHKSHSISMN